MTASSISRAERRRIQRLRSPAIGWLALGDARFFARHPERRNRVRLPGPAEVDSVTGFNVPAVLQAKPGFRLAIAVRLIAPGSMVAAIFPAWAGEDLDFSEQEAAFLFDLLTCHQPGKVDLLTRSLLDEAARTESVA